MSQKFTVLALASGAIGAGKADPPNNAVALGNGCRELMLNVIPSEGAGYIFGPSLADCVFR